MSGVNLVAPATVGTSTFWKWQLDGVDYTPSQSAADYDEPGLHGNGHLRLGNGDADSDSRSRRSRTAYCIRQTGHWPERADIFLINTDGTNVVNLTDAAGDDTRPAWSPDGTRLAYTCLRQPDGSIAPPQRICVRNADGTGLVVLSKLLAGRVWPGMVARRDTDCSYCRYRLPDHTCLLQRCRPGRSFSTRTLPRISEP